MGPGAFSICLFLPSFWSGSLVPRLWKGIPPTPLLLMARPSRLLRGSGGWLVGRRGRLESLSHLWLVDSFPFLPPGSCFCFSFCCLLCMFCVLITYVCCWYVLFACLSWFFSRSWLFVSKTLVFDPGVRGTVVGFPVHPWSCVLLVLRLACLSFVFSWRCGVLCLFFLLCLRCPVELFLFEWVCVGGLLSFACLLLPKRVCEHRRPLQHTV